MGRDAALLPNRQQERGHAPKGAGGGCCCYGNAQAFQMGNSECTSDCSLAVHCNYTTSDGLTVVSWYCVCPYVTSGCLCLHSAQCPRRLEAEAALPWVLRITWIPCARVHACQDLLSTYDLQLFQRQATSLSHVPVPHAHYMEPYIYRPPKPAKLYGQTYVDTRPSLTRMLFEHPIPDSGEGFALDFGT